MPATMPNIAIKPLKRSAPEFMTCKLKIEYNHRKKVVERGIPNDLTYEKILKKKNRNLIWQRRRNNPRSNQKNTLQNQKNRENFHWELFYNNTSVLYAIYFWQPPWIENPKDCTFLNLNFLIRLSIYWKAMRNLVNEWLLNLHWD